MKKLKMDKYHRERRKCGENNFGDIFDFFEGYGIGIAIGGLIVLIHLLL